MNKDDKLAKMISLVLGEFETKGVRIPYCGEFKDEKSLLNAEKALKTQLGIDELIFYVFTHKDLGSDYFGVNSTDLNALILKIMNENRIKYSDKLILKTTKSVIEIMRNKVESSLHSEDAMKRNFVGIKK